MMRYCTSRGQQPWQQQGILSGINQGSLRLIQAVADNFDADISSQNGKITTHSLAMLITQPTNASDDDQNSENFEVGHVERNRF